jgi:hypothetical protein
MIVEVKSGRQVKEPWRFKYDRNQRLKPTAFQYEDCTKQPNI